MVRNDSTKGSSMFNAGGTQKVSNSGIGAVKANKSKTRKLW